MQDPLSGAAITNAPVEPVLRPSLEQPADAAASSSDATVEHRLQFAGSGGEYFRIWIVNLILTILTLGIYSAWAKVRREQYFHRNTMLDGSGFDYHGNPVAILKGRIIAVILLVIMSALYKFMPTYYFLALLVFSPLVPFLLIRSFIFRARNTSFRGLHFNFLGTYKGFCKAFLGYIVVFILLLGAITYVFQSIENSTNQSFSPSHAVAQTEQDRSETHADDDEDEGSTDTSAAPMGSLSVWHIILLIFVPLGMFLLIPALMCSFKRYQLNHLAFGASRFHAQCRYLSFYGAYLRSLVPTLALLILLAPAVAAYFLFSGGAYGVVAAIIGAILIALGVLAYMFVLIVSPEYLKVLINNLVWNNTRLETHRFKSDMTFWGISGVVIVNWLLITLTLGIYWPWAAVRLAAYRARCTALVASGGLDNFIAGATPEKTALGEEIADAFDFDIAI